MYEAQNADALEKLRMEAEEAIGKLTDEELARADELESDFKAPVGTGFESDVTSIDDEDDGRESVLDMIERNERKEEFEDHEIEIERDKKEEGEE
ncbi:MAG: hypothetical protein MUF61_03525 [archaeon]|nr:hypothetical protein [archaeon]